MTASTSPQKTLNVFCIEFMHTLHVNPDTCFFFHFCKGKGKIAPATNWMHSSWNSKKRWKATFCNFTRIMLAGNAIANTGNGNVKRVHICSQTWCTKNVRILRWVQNSVRTWQGSIKNLKWNSQRQLSVPFFV